MAWLDEMPDLRHYALQYRDDASGPCCQGLHALRLSLKEKGDGMIEGK
jgi:hypothetical protein